MSKTLVSSHAVPRNRQRELPRCQETAATCKQLPSNAPIYGILRPYKSLKIRQIRKSKLVDLRGKGSDLKSHHHQYYVPLSNNHPIFVPRYADNARISAPVRLRARYNQKQSITAKKETIVRQKPGFVRKGQPLPR